MSNGKRLKRNYFHSGDGDVQEANGKGRQLKKGLSPRASRMERGDDHFDWKQELAKIDESDKFDEFDVSDKFDLD